MGKPARPKPGLLFLGLLWSDREALRRARSVFEERFGKPFLETPPEPFSHTGYYRDEMGDGITRSYLFFPRLEDPGGLAGLKLWTNSLERDAAGNPERPRPVNLDPGLLFLDKFVLATTKDRSHRIYIGEGVFAESTLYFHRGRFEPWPWTYPDYARAVMGPVFIAARRVLRRLLKEPRP